MSPVSIKEHEYDFKEHDIDNITEEEPETKPQLVFDNLLSKSINKKKKTRKNLLQEFDLDEETSNDKK